MGSVNPQCVGRNEPVTTWPALLNSFPRVPFLKMRDSQPNIIGCTIISALFPFLSPWYIVNPSWTSTLPRKQPSVYAQLDKWYKVSNYRRAKKPRERLCTWWRPEAEFLLQSVWSHLWGYPSATLWEKLAAAHRTFSAPQLPNRACTTCWPERQSLSFSFADYCKIIQGLKLSSFFSIYFIFQSSSAFQESYGFLHRLLIRLFVIECCF